MNPDIEGRPDEASPIALKTAANGDAAGEMKPGDSLLSRAGTARCSRFGNPVEEDMGFFLRLDGLWCAKVSSIQFPQRLAKAWK